MLDLSIIVPIYNERSHAAELERILEFAVRRNSFANITEVIVVDDGSTDGFIANHRLLIWLRRPHQGKAAAVQAGIWASNAKKCLVVDCDLSTPIEKCEYLVQFIPWICDVVIYSRGMQRKGASPSRRLLSLAHHMALVMLLNIPYQDTQCGFKAFDTNAARQIISALRVYKLDRLPVVNGPCISSGFDVELLLAAARLGYRVKEEPVPEWTACPSRRVRVVRDAWRGLVDLIKIRRAWSSS